MDKNGCLQDLHKSKELHVILEIGRHKSFGLDSNLIMEFTNRSNAILGVLIGKRFQLINLGLVVIHLERELSIK